MDILVKIISLYPIFVDTPYESDLVTTFLCSAWFDKSSTVDLADDDKLGQPFSESVSVTDRQNCKST